ncbi:MAG: zf-HC2 domain-containing protein [Bacteroidaceae bacterium]|nr:zf-HC2 domain-containing protein [Bacteroidaceae bacterium]
MKCNEFKEKVADLFDKTIDMQTQAQLSEHMKSCPECKAYYEELRETFDMLQPKEVKSEERRVLRPIFASSLWKTAAIFIAAAFLCGLSFAAYHAISSRKTAEEIADSLAIANEKLISLSKDGEAFFVTWTRGTWVVNAFGDSFREDALVRHSPSLRPNGVKIKIDGTEHDIHELLDKPASIVKKVELDMSTRTINLVTKPVQIPADVKGNINPDLTILLTGTVPKGAYQPVTIWKSKGIKESYDWHDYIYTSWTGQWENVRIHLKEAVNRKDHHVRINVCKGTPQKHIDRIKSIMKECGVKNYEIVKQ